MNDTDRIAAAERTLMSASGMAVDNDAGVQCEYAAAQVQATLAVAHELRRIADSVESWREMGGA